MTATVDSLLIATLLGMLLLSALQIIFRNVLDSGLLWADPMLRAMVLWIALLGAIVASREDKHIRIDVMSRFLPDRIKPYLLTVLYAFTCGVTSLLTLHSARFVVMEYQAPVMAFANVPTWTVQLILPIGFALIALRYLIHTLEQLSILSRRNSPP